MTDISTIKKIDYRRTFVVVDPKTGEEKNETINSVLVTAVEGKEAATRGPVIVRNALTKVMGKDFMRGLPVPGTKYDSEKNNPDIRQYETKDASGKKTVFSESYYKTQFKSSPDGLALYAKRKEITHGADGKKQTLTKEAKANKDAINSRISYMVGVLAKAAELEHAINRINEHGTVSVREKLRTDGVTPLNTKFPFYLDDRNDPDTGKFATISEIISLKTHDADGKPFASLKLMLEASKAETPTTEAGSVNSPEGAKNAIANLGSYFDDGKHIAAYVKSLDEESIEGFVTLHDLITGLASDKAMSKKMAAARKRIEAREADGGQAIEA